MRRAASAIVLTLLAGPAWADYLTGNKLHEMCQTPEGAPFNSFAGGYIVGFTDSWKDWEPGRLRMCIPPGATYGQIRDVVCMFVAQHPEHRHLPAVVMIRSAIQTVWPCSSQ